MLLGAEKRRKEAEEVSPSSRSDPSSPCRKPMKGVCDECKDVDMVSSTSLETSITHRSRDPRLDLRTRTFRFGEHSVQFRVPQGSEP
ncbi:hypothetical protein ACMD2_01227 [Ananas comosus]|uniref:Uncharacterized protein n=1 Tax=Ananas comosus TaxID=4615 RepID=A0A199UCW0_ANACO|nr:hypothetical protein ACMD2_01227 [Ananas comosus]